MKKVLALVMCIAMIACFAVTATAADYNVTMAVSNHENAKVGDVIEATVSISANSDLGALEFNIVGDTNYLKSVTGKDDRGRDIWFAQGEAAGGSVVCSDDKYAAENRMEVACANSDGYYKEGVFVKVFFEVIAELPEEGAVIDLTVNATTHYDDNTKTYEVDAKDGLVKGEVKEQPPVSSEDPKPPVSSEDPKPPVSSEDPKPVDPSEPADPSEPVDNTKPAETDTDAPADTNTDVTGTDTEEGATTDIPKTGETTAIAVAAGLCAVMAAAFVITKKVND